MSLKNMIGDYLKRMKTQYEDWMKEPPVGGPVGGPVVPVPVIPKTQPEAPAGSTADQINKRNKQIEDAAGEPATYKNPLYNKIEEDKKKKGITRDAR